MNALFFALGISSGIEIVAKRLLNPLFHIDLIWNSTAAARRLREYSRYGHALFRRVRSHELNIMRKKQ